MGEEEEEEDMSFLIHQRLDRMGCNALFQLA
jgi:hypothetical protein